MAGSKTDRGRAYGPADFFPSLAPPDFFDPTVQVAAAPSLPIETERPANVVDIPHREGQNDVEDGWDRWVQMCWLRARARGL